MIVVPRDATEAEVLGIVRELVELLARSDYAAFADEVGYLRAFGLSAETCIKRDLVNYRSPEYFPGEEEFVVTSCRTATGGNPNPRHSVAWYVAGHSSLIGAIDFDLPLNGRWSDLSADFALFETGHKNGFLLQLEELGSSVQICREQMALDALAGSHSQS